MSGRARGPNYTNEEKILLLNIINDYKNIIVCKKTDTISWKDKETAWLKITEIFNSASPNLVHRSKDSIQKFYENKKKEIRKSAAADRIELIKTGGGKANINNNLVKEIMLNIINPKTISGLNNKFDGDNCFENSVSAYNTASTSKASALTEENLIAIEHGDRDNVNNITTEDIVEVMVPPDTNNSNIIVEDKIETQGTNNEIDWGRYNASNLKTPLHKKLVSPKQNKTSEIWGNRRRPTQALNSSHLSEQYSDLAVIKLELASLQLKVFKADADARQEREKIEFDLKKKCLELDIQIKEIQLRKLLNQYSS